MWGVGVITYLLLTGHSPFVKALMIQDPVASEKEVIRLSGLGKIDKDSRAWLALSPDAKNFICSLIQQDALRRPSPAEAWSLPFLGRSDKILGNVPRVPRPRDRSALWARLDSFQQLAWLAFARGAAEPELVQVRALHTFIMAQSIGCTMYLETLAMELAAVVMPHWLQPRAAWEDVLQLAFRYLDVDGDGLLSVGDLRQHLEGDGVDGSARGWVRRWAPDKVPPHGSGLSGISLADFRRALGSTAAVEERLDAILSNFDGFSDDDLAGLDMSIPTVALPDAPEAN